MELSGLTNTELYHQIIKLKQEHEKLKNSVVSTTKKIDELVVEVNNNLNNLKSIENNYIKYIDEYNKR